MRFQTQIAMSVVTTTTISLIIAAIHNRQNSIILDTGIFTTMASGTFLLELKLFNIITQFYESFGHLKKIRNSSYLAIDN